MRWLALALTWSWATSLVLTDSTGKETYIFSPFFMEEGVKSFEVTAPLIGFDNIFDPKWDSNPVTKNKVGIMTGGDIPGKFREDYAFRGSDLGLVALIDFTSWQPDHFGEFYSPARVAEIPIPYLSVSQDDRDDVIRPMLGPDLQGNVTVTVNSWDSPNEWPATWDTIWFKVIWRGLLAAYSFILAFYTLYALLKWYQYYRQAKTWSKIAVLCLVVEFICCVERGIFCAIGGLLACRFANYPTSRLMYTGTMPLTFLTTALTAAYLHEVLTTKSPLGTMVQKTQKPLAVLSIYYLLTDWPLSLISSFSLFFGSAYVSTIAAATLTAGTAVTAILLLWITVRLSRYYKKKAPKRAATERESISGGKKDKSDKDPPDRLKELVDRVQICSFWLLWTTVGFAATLLSWFHTPVGFILINIFIFIGLNTTSLMHILAYGKTPRIPKRASTTAPSMRSSVDNGSSNPPRKSKMPNLAVSVADTPTLSPSKEDRSDALSVRVEGGSTVSSMSDSSEGSPEKSGHSPRGSEKPAVELLNLEPNAVSPLPEIHHQHADSHDFKGDERTRLKGGYQELEG